MIVTFYSNFHNPHQEPFCEAMSRLTNGQFTFVATEKMSQERLKMGFEDTNQKYPYVLSTYVSPENEKRAEQLAIDSDVIIIGSAPEKYVRLRMKKKKLTFRYSERLYKKGLLRVFSPRAFPAIRSMHIQYKKFPLYMLCASAYTAFDYAIWRTYIGKTFKWGYFTYVKEYDIDALIKKKIKAPVSILWAGRLIGLKHPDASILMAEVLKKLGYSFHLNIIGDGELMPKLRKMIQDKNLEREVSLLGFLPPEEVRRYMEQSEIYLFTSDYNEGWGAVLGEAMNSGCATVVSHAVGAAPFLIQDGKNGLIYKSRSKSSLTQEVCKLLDDELLRHKLGKNAYFTMKNYWNPNIAAKRFLELSRALLEKDKMEFNQGPCSRAEIIKQWNVYRLLKGKREDA